MIILQIMFQINSNVYVAYKLDAQMRSAFSLKREGRGTQILDWSEDVAIHQGKQLRWTKYVT